MVIQGLADYIVVEDNETLLIFKKEEEQRIKEFRGAFLINFFSMDKKDNFRTTDFSDVHRLSL